MSFKDQVVWITGASSGIGEALVYAFAQSGAKVIISARNEATLHKVKSNCGPNAKKCAVLPLDLAQNTNFDAKAKAVIEKFGRIDYLINVAGISQRSLVMETPIEVDRKVMEVNFFGTVALTKSVLPYMLKQQSGHIAVTTSITGKFGFPLRSAYAASKHALQGYFETLRAEVSRYNLFVTIIIPGRVKTNISMNALTKDGSSHKEMDPGQENGMPAEKSAELIIKALRFKKKEVLVGNTEVLMVYIRKFMPWLYYRMVTKINPK